MSRTPALKTTRAVALCGSLLVASLLGAASVQLAGRRVAIVFTDSGRMVTRITSRGRGVTVSGRITRPLARLLQTVVVTRRVSCGRVEVVKRFKPSRSGRFRVNLPAAKRRQVAVFRFRTLVRHNASDPKLSTAPSRCRDTWT